MVGSRQRSQASQLLGQCSFPSLHRPAPEMPVPAEIMVREAATGPYPNHEREEIRLSCKMPLCSQFTITRSSGPCRDAAVHPPVGLGVQPCYTAQQGPL